MREHASGIFGIHSNTQLTDNRDFLQRCEGPCGNQYKEKELNRPRTLEGEIKSSQWVCKSCKPFLEYRMNLENAKGDMTWIRDWARKQTNSDEHLEVLSEYDAYEQLVGTIATLNQLKGTIETSRHW